MSKNKCTLWLEVTYVLGELKSRVCMYVFVGGGNNPSNRIIVVKQPHKMSYMCNDHNHPLIHICTHTHIGKQYRMNSFLSYVCFTNSYRRCPVTSNVFGSDIGITIFSCIQAEILFNVPKRIDIRIIPVNIINMKVRTFVCL